LKYKHFGIIIIISSCQDQRRYALSLVQRYLPTFSLEPTIDDQERFLSPLPADFVWSKRDCSPDPKSVMQLEHEYGFKMRAVVGSLNYLANTAYEELYAIRKACKFMHSPGRPHFNAVLHLLHHLRCHPPQAIKFYHCMDDAPVSLIFPHSALGNTTRRFFGMSDSSFMDDEGMRSTGCDLCVISGGIVEMGSFVPEPVAMSTAEAECNALTIALMKLLHIKFIVTEIMKGDSHYPYSIPILSDSSSAIAIASNEKETKRTKHIERRWQYIKYACLAAKAVLYHVDKDYNLADVGTKNLPHSSAKMKLSMMEVTSPDVLHQQSKPSLSSLDAGGLLDDQSFKEGC
jgi:hypothetical protein